jgi:hypothetical protein
MVPNVSWRNPAYFRAIATTSSPRSGLFNVTIASQSCIMRPHVRTAAGGDFNMSCLPLRRMARLAMNVPFASRIELKTLN